MVDFTKLAHRSSLSKTFFKSTDTKKIQMSWYIITMGTWYFLTSIMFDTFFKASSLCRRIEAPAECAILPLASFDDCFLPDLALMTYLHEISGI